MKQPSRVKEKMLGWKLANQIQGDIQTWLKEHDKKSLRIKYKQIDQLRLLRLEVWARRYYLSIDEILTLIMPVLRGQKKIWKKNVGLGISVSIFTSDTAERILTEEIKKKYPNSEHILLWKEQARERQLEVEEIDNNGGIATRKKVVGSMLQYDSPKEFIAAYTQAITAQRKKTQIIYNQSWRKKRNYRSNPWR